MGTRCADHVTPLYPQKLALTSPTDGGRSVGIVRSRTKAMEFSLVLVISYYDGPSICTHTMQEAKLVLCITSESLKKTSGSNIAPEMFCPQSEGV